MRPWHVCVRVMIVCMRAPSPITNNRPDITKVREALGWSPTIPLRTGLAMMVEDFRKRLGVAPKKEVSPAP